MTQYAFGAGSLYTIPSGTTPSPSQFGAVQQIGVDFSANTVNLFGQYQFPLASARGTVKIDGSGKFAQLAGKMLNNIFFANSSIATGDTLISNNEAHSVPGSSTYTVTVSNTTGWIDLGVQYASNGDPLMRVAPGAEATGKYSAAAGVYTFAVGDAGIAMLFSYSYTSAGGETLTINNALMGVAPAFTAVFNQVYNAQQHVLTLNKAIAAKFTLQSALEDFVKPDFTFGAFSDSSNVVGTWSFADAA